MKVALVHDWLTGMRGGEKVLQDIASLYPAADLFTLIHTPGTCTSITEGRQVHTSWLNTLPGVRHYYRYLLPFMPKAAESLNLTGYDLVLSTSHCVVKGVRCDPGTVHLCYCHSPMRYIWTQIHAYQQSRSLGTLGLKMFAKRLRRWDLATADRVTHFIANSQNVAGRIRDTYGRDSTVIYPPADTEFYTPAPAVKRDGPYLVVSALAPYKRVDHAVEAFRQMPDRQLVIIGTGQYAKVLQRDVPANVTFLGWGDESTLRDHYRSCRALLFPGEEDFGIVPVEAMACGAPVIAYDAGGARETVANLLSPEESGPTGLRYKPQTVTGLCDAIECFETRRSEFDPACAVARAQQFSRQAFRDAYQTFVNTHLPASTS